MSIVNGISRIGYMKGGGKALWKDENIADSIAAYAINWIEQRVDMAQNTSHCRKGECDHTRRSQTHLPFFMYLCTNDVHVPPMAAPSLRRKEPHGFER